MSDALLPSGSSGKELIFTPNAKAGEKLLKKAAREGYYYPRLALKQLDSLSTGPIGKNNVYIPNINDSRATTFHLFYVILPGIKATVERRSNDKYYVTHFEFDSAYQSVKSEGRPGVHSVSRKAQNFSVELRESGKISSVEGRTVVIADGDYKSPREAAIDAYSRLDKTAGPNVKASGEFDIFFSPAGQKLGGMRKYNPALVTQANAFASLLANAMEDAAKYKKNVFWVAEHGGSVIFTQSMEILARKQINFKDANHSFYLFKPSCDPVATVQVAQKLGMHMNKDFVKVGGLRTSARMMIVNSMRAKDKNDEYNWGDYGKDIAKNAMQGIALSGVGIYAGGLLAPGVGAIATAGIIVTGICSAELLWTKSKNYRK